MAEPITWQLPVRIDAKIGEVRDFSSMSLIQHVSDLDVDGVTMKVFAASATRMEIHYPSGLIAKFDLTAAVKGVAGLLHVAATPDADQEA